jgi:outer membrane receptor protein involved in Fe transport
LHTYTGLRYTASDNTDWLNHYMLGAIVGGKEFKWKKYALVITGQINNVWNASYEVVPDRPMPGRNYLATITIKL